MYSLPEGPKYIHYIHHPPEAILNDTKRFQTSLFWKLYTVPLRLFYNYSNLPADSSAAYFSNSSYTQEKIKQYYPDLHSIVVYPPVVDKQPVKFHPAIDKSINILSIGSFTPDKNQLSQLQIAESIRDANFHLIGSKKSDSYYARCEHYMSEKELNNVQFLPNATEDEKVEILANSQFFLHTKETEHFGVAIVEAIWSGLIPIIPNSGGQTEVVSIKELRYDSIEEAKNILNRLIKSPPERLQKIHEQLISKARQFTFNNFQKQMDRALE